MKQVIVRQFGGPEVLEVEDAPTPSPASGQVLVRLTSIGLNHADLMGRRGEYKLSTGEPPFTPGLEGGGIIEAVGEGTDSLRVGDRVTLTPDARSAVAGTYRSHVAVPAEQAMRVPGVIPDGQLGALWLAYLTAWGCLAWKQNLAPGATVALPAASSSVALAAAQIVRHLGGTAIGLTSSPEKADRLAALDTAAFDHLVVTHEPGGAMKPWRRELRRIAPGGIDVFFDPVASGAYLENEIKCLAPYGTIWVYGLLGDIGPVGVTPLIRKHAAIRGWVLGELVDAGDQAWGPGCGAILDGFAEGIYRQHIAATFRLAEIRRAHIEMEKGDHIGKFVLVP